MKELLGHAASLGVSVHLASLEDEPRLLGYYVEEDNLIIVRLGMTNAQNRWVLAHEIGHAYHGHRCLGPDIDDAAERQADKYGATLLIEPDEFARLERMDPSEHWLAEEFTVSVEAIRAYRRHCLTRLRGVTYSGARMGLKQWAHRLQPA